MELFRDSLLMEHWLIVSTIFGFIMGLYLMALNNKQLLKPHKASLYLGLIVVAVVCLWIGSRPWYCYADSGLYGQEFMLVQSRTWARLNDLDNEWFWAAIEYYFIYFSDLNSWILTVACIYILTMAAAAMILMRNHYLVAIAFLFTAFSFFSYGTNGLRNGAATSISLLGLSIIASNLFKKKIISYSVGFILLYLASAIHQTLLLILVAGAICVYYKNTKTYTYIWLLFIILALIIPTKMQSLYGSLINDERMTSYTTFDNKDIFSTSGFRLDFLIYSSVPIILGWYVLFKKKIKDDCYCYLLNIYIIANAFWCGINSVAYSNRFAYISWFILPILIAYPFVRFNIFKNQGFIIGLTMIGYTIFNLIFGI